MPRKSKADQLEFRLIEDLERKCFDPEVPAYVQHRCAATLATMLKRRDKRLETKAAAAAARRAAKAKAEHKWPSVLPSNGREPLAVPVAAPAFDLGAWMDKSGINRG
jgi:hypothetical protein